MLALDQPAEGRHRRVHEEGIEVDVKGKMTPRNWLRSSTQTTPSSSGAPPKANGGVFENALADQGDRARRQRHRQQSTRSPPDQEGAWSWDEHPRAANNRDRPANTPSR